MSKERTSYYEELLARTWLLLGILATWMLMLGVDTLYQQEIPQAGAITGIMGAITFAAGLCMGHDRTYEAGYIAQRAVLGAGIGALIALSQGVTPALLLFAFTAGEIIGVTVRERKQENL